MNQCKQILPAEGWGAQCCPWRVGGVIPPLSSIVWQYPLTWYHIDEKLPHYRAVRPLLSGPGHNPFGI